jgi:parallel beta-helix repeat protein
MKKLIYLIVVIVALSLIIAGCGIPVVPPAEQDEPGTLPNKVLGGPDEVWNSTTTTQFSTIQAAITAALPGETIIVGAGTYNEGSLVFNTDDITLFGSGADTTTIITSSSTYGISVPSGVDNITIKGFTIEENTAHDGDKVTSRFHLKISHNSGFTLEDVNLVGPGRDNSCITGLDLHTVQGVTIKNVEITGYSKNGVGVTATTSNLLFEDVTIDNNGYTDSTGWAGIAFYTMGMGGGDITDVKFAGTNSISNNPMGVFIENLEYYVGVGGEVNITGTGTTTLSGNDIPLVATNLGDFSIVDVYAKNVFNVPVRLEDAFASPPEYAILVSYWHDVTSAGMAANNLLADGNPVIFNLTNGEWYVVEGMSIQAAIDAASAGDTINVTNGLYTITSKILVDEGVTITGNVIHPENVVVQYSSLTDSLIFDMRASDAVIEGFKTTNGKSGFWFDQSYITGCTISNCIVDNVGEYGIYMKNGGSGHTISNNIISNTGKTYAPAPAVLIQSCFDVTFSNNALSLISDKGVYVLDCNANGVEVTGNNISGCAYAAIRTETQTTISGNQISGGGTYGIFVASGAAGSTVSGNTISNTNSEGIQSDVKVTITDNDIFGGYHGIQLSNAASGSVIDGNNIHDNQHWGLSILYTVTDVTVQNNQLSYNGYGGVIVRGSADGSGIHINYNEITGNVVYGVGSERTTFDVDAENNWWGHPGGPLRLNPDDVWAGPKKADRVSRNVDYHPWLHKPMDN